MPRSHHTLADNDVLHYPQQRELNRAADSSGVSNPADALPLYSSLVQLTRQSTFPVTRLHGQEQTCTSRKLSHRPMCTTTGAPSVVQTWQKLTLCWTALTQHWSSAAAGTTCDSGIRCMITNGMKKEDSMSRPGSGKTLSAGIHALLDLAAWG